MKKFLVPLVILMILFVTKTAWALTCGDNYDSGDKNQVEQIIASCQQKISDSKSQQSSLKSAIGLLNSKINLISAQIRDTNLQINQLEKEIAVLSTVVSNLNEELNNLSAVYISRVREAYKRRETNPLIMFFSSDSFTTFENRLKYLQVAERRDQLILRELELSRIDFDQQKTVKEQKQLEVEALKTSLSKQSSSLASQQKSKQTLLQQTQNSEAQYQSLLSKAQSQLAAFRRFVSSKGGATVLNNQTFQSDWGKYYNQRDSLWANQLIGNSSEDMKNVGCLITSMAMVATHYGKDLTPGQIAASSDPFFGNTAYMLLSPWTVNGVTMSRSRIGSTTAAIDGELGGGHPVIVGIYGGPDHFLVIKSKDGNDYIMNDPFVENGHDIKFTSQYPLSAISSVDKVSVN